MSSHVAIVARAQFQRASVACWFISSFLCLCREVSQYQTPEIVGSRYSDVGVARIVREDKWQQDVFDTTELIGMNWSEVHIYTYTYMYTRVLTNQLMDVTLFI